MDERKGSSDGKLMNVEEGHDTISLFTAAPYLQKSTKVMNGIAWEACHVGDEPHEVLQQVRQRLWSVKRRKACEFFFLARVCSALSLAPWAQ